MMVRYEPAAEDAWMVDDATHLAAFLDSSTGRKLTVRLQNSTYLMMRDACAAPTNGDWLRGAARGARVILSHIDADTKGAKEFRGGTAHSPEIIEQVPDDSPVEVPLAPIPPGLRAA